MKNPTNAVPELTAPEIITTWEALVDELSRLLATSGGQLGKQCNLTVYASHAGGPTDQSQFKALAAPLLHCIIQHGVERPLQRRAAKKSTVAQVAISVDCVNDWFFVRVSDDGAQVRNDVVYAVGGELSAEVSRLLATGGHFAVERSNARGMSYTFSWERRDVQLVALPDHEVQGNSESAA
ncbi:MAG: hypothetical protein FJ146_09095 [Deltaproteobacteria bacterium]|nr:hypothetical protein [Deltaproteobacteria bacterium]